MVDNNTDARRAAWTRYWGTGALHSCAGSWDGNYGGAIATYWEQRFAALRPEHRVLDLGTGNGPLPALMLEARGADGLPQVDAVDLAEPSPGWLARMPGTARDRIRFTGGVDMAALPFDDGSFDLVCSQFGFEYADRKGALTEILRVLVPGGAVALVCHHAESRLAEVAREEVSHIDWLAGDGQVFDHARALLPYIALSASAEGVARLRGDPAANSARDAFNASLEALQERAARSAVPDPLFESADTLMRLMQVTAAEGEARGRAALDAWRGALTDAALRSRELLEHALDDAARLEIEAALGSNGMSVESTLLREGGHLLAWGIDARQPSG